MCLAKANSAASLDAALVQDLRVGEGQAVEVGDFLEVSYTGWLMQNHAMGQVRQLFSWRLLFLLVAAAAETRTLSRTHLQICLRSLTPARTKTSCCASKWAQAKSSE